MRIYLAGPMQGYPQFNFPLFYAAAEFLRAQGLDVVSPAELDDREDQGLAAQSPDGKLTADHKTWGEYLARDVKLLADDGIEGIIFLPGWQKSKGAKLEAFVGVLGKFPYFATLEVSDVDGLVHYELTDRSLGWVIREVSNFWADEIAAHTPINNGGW